MLYYTENGLIFSHFTDYDINLNGGKIDKAIMKKIEKDSVLNIPELSLLLYIFFEYEKITKKRKLNQISNHYNVYPADQSNNIDKYKLNDLSLYKNLNNNVILLPYNYYLLNGMSTMSMCNNIENIYLNKYSKTDICNDKIQRIKSDRLSSINEEIKSINNGKSEKAKNSFEINTNTKTQNNFNVNNDENNITIIDFSKNVPLEIREIHFRKKCSETECERFYYRGKDWVLSLNPKVKKRLCHCHNTLEYQKKHFGQIIISIFNNS